MKKENIKVVIKYKLLPLIVFLLVFGFGSQATVASIDPISKVDLTGATDQLVSYNSQNIDYAFKYPSTWNVYEIPGMSYLRVENIDARKLGQYSKNIQNQYFKIEVIKLSSDGLSLKDWVNRQNTTSYPLPKVISQENIEVAGYPAIYQIEQFGSLVHPAIFVSKGDSVYILNILSSDAKYDQVVEEIINNFEIN